VLSPKDYIVKVIEECKPDLLFFPDEGASKRYADMFPTYKYIYGNKKREWETGKIICTEIINPFDVDLKNKTVLIIDDICSRGTTFVKSAEALQLYNVGDIYLWITHCENTILDGEIFNSGLIKKVYTTNSLFTKTHESIKVIKI
jgi:ribose-phosphate pyrophosphokinase